MQAALGLDVAALLRATWKEVAFCCRYGHQSFSEMLDLPKPDLHRLFDAVHELVRAESPKMTPGTSED